ncbi:slit homolog 1 protein isoform X2 [Parasteatoda tepidariorum]|nr:slit homolog 1 protein-like [Parasteatoda tepidariorum]
MMIVLVLVLLVKTALSGSPCPPRENIYPCSCLNIKAQGSMIKTVVQCHRLHDKDTLGFVFHSLKSVNLDYFTLYDSFWNAEISTNKDTNPKAFPRDWLTSLRSKSIEIIDTSLPPCFACNFKSPCKNFETTRFVTVNSTSSSNLCPLCPTGRNNSYPWINCMNKLQELVLIRGKIETLGADFFPKRLESLKKLNLSHNEIRLINPRAFQGLDTLLSMDLSHNRIDSLQNMFINPMKLYYLDVSWNKIENLDATFFIKLPNLKLLFARSNHIAQLQEEHWKNLPITLTFADLADNPIKCNCNMKWVNSTIPQKTYLKGHCSRDKFYTTRNLKLNIKYFLQWCEKINKTTTVKPKQKQNSMLLVNKSEATNKVEQIMHIN